MKRTHMLKFVLTSLLGIAAGMPVSSLADDTEIYLGNQNLRQGVRPNVLFILDTSGSMSSNVSGTGMDRLDNMKAAFNQIMDETNNINVGLMRFTDPGGPILFPVSYIDEDISVIEGGPQGNGMDINVRVSQSSDDAEEVVTGIVPPGGPKGVVNLTSDQLELAELTGLTGGGSVQAAVISQGNNAEQRLGDGDIITQNRIDMNSSQTNAVRFENVDIPPGAQILDARITFTSRGGNSGSPQLRFYGEAGVNPAQFQTSCNSCDDVSNRTKITNGAGSPVSVVWNPPAWTNGVGYDTSDLSAIVQAIVDQSGWTSTNNAVVFIEEHGGSGSRGAHSYRGSSSQAPKFTVTYALGTGTFHQTIGLRFQDVAIPKDAVITNAVIEFAPALPATANTDLIVYGEAIGDAATFNANPGDISSRTKTLANVDWGNVPTWDDVDIIHQSPDLAAIVQEVVNGPNWCGNNAMAFLLELSGSNAGPRIAESFDGDPSRAPILRIDFDENPVTSDPCINQIVQRQVGFSDDDAEETISSGSISLTGNQFDMRGTQVNGLRFRDLPINQGQQILSAELVFTARDTDTGGSTLTFKGQAIDDAPGYSNNPSDVSARNPKTSASATWTPTDWDTVDVRHTAPGLGAVIQEIVNNGAWAPGNNLAIIQSHTSGAQRRAYTFNGSPANAPMLRIKVAGKLSTGGAGIKSVRTRMKEIVDGLDHKGHTPIVDTLYEAARYYRGDSAYWGKTRGFDRNPPTQDFNADSTNNAVRRNTRVSHPSSYTGGTMFRDIGCTNANLNDAACITEAIQGNPVYDTPITEECQANYVVLLTDGEANHNDSAQLIRDYVPKASCISSNNDEECARDLVDWLRNNDQSSSLAGTQAVTTYTIGFNFSGQFLKDLANLGGGTFHEASTASELANVFQTIIADILAQTTSFTAPTLSVNAFNKLFHRNEVYFSFFKPERRIGWDGNVKKYQLCEDTADGCTLGEVLDADGTSAIGTDGSIIDSALSFWSSGTDGAEITVGGAGNEIPVNGSRTVLTYTGTTPPNGVNLGGLSHRVEDSNSDLTKALLGDAAMSDAERTDLINWIRGMDVDDVDADGDTTEDRYAFNDPLHSNPVVITYGGTESDPVLKVLVGTNDGGLRLINAFNGEEQWIIYPQSTLAKQRQVRPNPSGNHLYGLDGTPSVWVNDVDRDGTIEPSDGDFVRAFIGMRRGGDYIYAIEANPNANFDGQPGNTDDVDSTLLWRVKGDSTEFPRLGQTWSKPMLTSVRVGTTNAGESAYKDVLVFAGGYDETEDNGFGSGGLGNAIYFADPADGSRLLSISSHDPGSGQRLVVPDMTYPIPSDISLMDSDGDGATDRLYVGDTGGQLWRIDLAPDLSASAGLKPIVGKLAVLSDSVDPADRRKIFYQPDVMRASDNQYSSDARYDMVMVVTGNRANPLSTEVVDRAYAIRDFNVDGLSDSNDDGLADGLTTIQGPLVSSTGDLFNATNAINPTGSDLSDLRSAKGWYVDLEESGEKALARPVVIAGKMFFTTYLPDAVVAATNCSLAEGGGRLYGLNVLNAAPVLNWDGLGDDTNLVKNDRHQQLGSGIPSGVVTVYQEEGVTGLVGSGAGAKPFDPGAEFPRFRTYWYEEG